MATRVILLMGSIILAASLSRPLLAQEVDPTQMAMGYSQAVTANIATMGQYSWQQRIEVVKDGEVVWIDLYQVRFDAEGKLQKNLVNHDVQVGKKKRIRGKVQSDKLGGLEDAVGNLENMTRAYATASAGEVLDFFLSAQISRAADYDDTSLVQGGNFLADGDQVSLWVDNERLLPVKMILGVAADGKPVNVEVDYRHLRDGPLVMDHILMELPEDNLTVKYENFDYLLQQ